MRDETCLHIIDAPETHHDAGMHADNTYKVEAINKTCPEKGKHVMTRTTAHDILNTKSNHNNSWQTSPRQEFATTLAIYDEEFAAAATLATHDKEFDAATLTIYDEEFATLASYDEEFATAATIAAYDKESAAATLATYDEEFATLATYDEEFDTLATYDEEFAADATLERGSPWGNN
jgi:hypothetical protein